MAAMSLDASWCEITEGRDFYDWQEPVHWIISNPPWSKIRPFLRHAMSVADNVVFLVTLTHLDTRARDREIEAAGFGRKEALIVPNPPAAMANFGVYARCVSSAARLAWRPNIRAAGAGTSSSRPPTIWAWSR
jgi:hypothetical protein